MIYEFQATQSYNGYDSPWPAGGGKNLWPDNVGGTGTRFDCTVTYANGGVTVVGTASDSGGRAYLRSDFISMKAGTYYLQVFNENTNGKATPAFVPQVDSAYIALDSNRKFTLSADTDTFNIGCNVTSNNEYNYSASLVLSTEKVTTYSPYSNICMPEGFNIWDPSQDKMIQVYAGYVNANTRELYLRPVYEEYAGEELVGPWMSSMDEYSEDATPTEGAFVIDFGGELTSYEITPFMLQTLLDSLGIRQHFTDGAGLLNSLMDQAQGRVRSEEELLHLSRPLKVIAIGDQLPAGLTFKPISKDVLPGLPGKFIR